MGKLADQVAIVTGASSGLGKAISLALASEGARLVLAARSEAKLRTLADEIMAVGAEALVVPTDVSDEVAVDRLFQEVQDRFGVPELLVNNAGLAAGGAAHELSFETWREVLSVNLDGAFLCSRNALALMKPRGKGRIINIGSVSAKVPRPNSAPYTSSKFALEGLTRAMALDARDYGVAVSILHPGNTDTPIWDARREVAEQEGLMDACDLAKLVVAMAALPSDVNFLEGTVLPVKMPFLGRG